jgi:hypothetical protein
VGRRPSSGPDTLPGVLRGRASDGAADGGRKQRLTMDIESSKAVTPCMVLGIQHAISDLSLSLSTGRNARHTKTNRYN